MIETDRLQLRPITQTGFKAILADDPFALSTLLQANVAPDWLAFPAAQQAMPFAAQFLAEHPEAAQWWSYFFVHQPSTTLIGLGGFGGLPTPERVVQIGYSIAPSFQQYGYATEATQGLLRFAFSSGLVDRVDAHTLPMFNSSTKVLAKVGFRFQGETLDAQEGKTWLWSLLREDDQYWVALQNRT